MKNKIVLLLCCSILLLSGCGKKSEAPIISEQKDTLPVITETVVAAVEQDGLRGYIDREGNWLIEPRYKQAFQFSNGYASVSETGVDPFSGSVFGGKYYWIGVDGTTIIVDSDEAFHFYEDHSFRSWGGYYYQIDTNGKDISGPYARVWQGYGGPDKVELENGRQFYIDGAGNELFENTRDVATQFVNGFALTMKDSIVSHIDTSGVPLYEGGFSTAGEISEGFAAVEKDKKWGFIDETGTVVIPFMFDNVSKFSDGLAGINLGGKRGVINTIGDIIVQPRYYYLGSFYDGFAPASYDGKTLLYIDKTGTEISTSFPYGSQFREGLSIIESDGALGYANTDGEIVVSPVYERASYFMNVHNSNAFERLD